MIRARVWFRRGGRQTVRLWVGAGDSHRVELAGPCTASVLGAEIVLRAGDRYVAGPFFGPFSYVVRYGP